VNVDESLADIGQEMPFIAKKQNSETSQQLSTRFNESKETCFYYNEDLRISFFKIFDDSDYVLLTLQYSNK